MNPHLIPLPAEYLPERFRAKYTGDALGCWLWTGARSREGYGFFHLTNPRRMVRAHRFAYETLVGPIPSGRQLDHLCRRPGCVNPKHLQVVTSRENTLLGSGPTAVNARLTKCRRGHDLPTKRNRSGRRRCRVCENANDRRRYAARKNAVPGLRG